jgi:Ca2+-binding RTX toxin-like protein
MNGGGGSDTADYSSATQRVVVDLPGHIALGAQIGTDTLSGMENVTTGSGNDAVAGDGATNRLDGGGGTDTVSYYAVSSGVVLDLAAQIGLDGTSTDTLLNFENANGTGYNDAISGTAAANVLDGLGGIDTISYYRATQGVVIDLAAKVAVQGGITDTILNFENANGSAFNDAISGNAAANVLDGLGGIDTLSYYASPRGLIIDLASTRVVDGSVTDTVRNFENANATSLNDAVSGNAAANVLNGLGGTDTISYYASAQGVTINLTAGTGVSGGVTDTLLNFENVNGSAFADSITGNGGANVLNGLGGADTLTGGGNFDTFEFRAGQASGDVITDFTGDSAAAGDIIKLVGFGTAAQGASFTQLNATQWQIHSGLDGHNEVITLSNGAAVHGSDFFFV